MESVDSTFGAVLIGAMASTILFGITCSQCCLYINTYGGEDRKRLQALVGFAWLLDAVQQALMFHMLWYYLVCVSTADDKQGALSANWSLIAQVVPTEISAAVAECYFIARIFYFLGKNRWVLVLVLPIFFGCCMGLGYIIKAFYLPFFTDALRAKWIVAGNASARVVTDIAIALTMSYIMYKNYDREFTSRSTSLLKIIVRYAVTTGFLTSLVAIAYLVAYLTMPLNMVYIGVYFVHGKLYTNSMLAALNSRESLRDVAAQSLSLAPHDFNSRPSSVHASRRRRSNIVDLPPIRIEPTDVHLDMREDGTITDDRLTPVWEWGGTGSQCASDPEPDERPTDARRDKPEAYVMMDLGVT